MPTVYTLDHPVYTHTFVRPRGAWSSEEAVETLRQALPYRQWIVGVGLDSSEVGRPPEGFEAVFEEAEGTDFAR